MSENTDPDFRLAQIEVTIRHSSHSMNVVIVKVDNNEI